MLESLNAREFSPELYINNKLKFMRYPSSKFQANVTYRIQDIGTFCNLQLSVSNIDHTVGQIKFYAVFHLFSRCSCSENFNFMRLIEADI